MTYTNSLGGSMFRAETVDEDVRRFHARTGRRAITLRLARVKTQNRAASVIGTFIAYVGTTAAFCLLLALLVPPLP
jgi:hypothetical protein